MKRIVFCADGTWDSESSNTNVFKLFNALTVSSEQMPFYDTGVGSNGNPIQKLVGGAFGEGLFQKIKDGYTRIAHAYQTGDQLFLFGFSRGAYTARSLGGMISTCGLPSQNFDDALVDTVFEAYRNRQQRAAILGTLAERYGMVDAPITMIGVWDTVGSLGIPALFGGIDPFRYEFLDTTLHPNVQNAFHALAIDERRRSFPATLWTFPPDAPAVPGQTVEQVWFCGVHSDVGGGYPGGSSSTTLSDIALCWMMNKAQALGVTIAPAALARYEYPIDPIFALDELHDSWGLLWGFPCRRPIPDGSSLANSVLIRCQHHGNYQPDNLLFEAGLPAAGYRVLPIMAPPP